MYDIPGRKMPISLLYLNLINVFSFFFFSFLGKLLEVRHRTMDGGRYMVVGCNMGGNGYMRESGWWWEVTCWGKR